MATKRVESFWAPCLDAGSTPATSTFDGTPPHQNQQKTLIIS